MINELQILKTVIKKLAKGGIPDMDSEYIAKWVKKLDITEFYKKVSHE